MIRVFAYDEYSQDVHQLVSLDMIPREPRFHQSTSIRDPRV